MDQSLEDGKRLLCPQLGWKESYGGGLEIKDQKNSHWMTRRSSTKVKGVKGHRQCLRSQTQTMNGAEVENNKISVSFSGITGFYQPHGLHDEANRAVWLDWWKTGILWTDIKG